MAKTSRFSIQIKCRMMIGSELKFKFKFLSKHERKFFIKRIGKKIQNRIFHKLTLKSIPSMDFPIVHENRIQFSNDPSCWFHFALHSSMEGKSEHDVLECALPEHLRLELCLSEMGNDNCESDWFNSTINNIIITNVEHCSLPKNNNQSKKNPLNTINTVNNTSTYLFWDCHIFGLIFSFFQRLFIA